MQQLVIEGDTSSYAMVEPLMAKIRVCVQQFYDARLGRWTWPREKLDFYFRAMFDFLMNWPPCFVSRFAEKEYLMAESKYANILVVVNVARESKKLPLLVPDHVCKGVDWELDNEHAVGSN
jgi:hypothetical protein